MFENDCFVANKRLLVMSPNIKSPHAVATSKTHLAGPRAVTAVQAQIWLRVADSFMVLTIESNLGWFTGKGTWPSVVFSRVSFDPISRGIRLLVPGSIFLGVCLACWAMSHEGAVVWLQCIDATKFATLPVVAGSQCTEGIWGLQLPQPLWTTVICFQFWFLRGHPSPILELFLCYIPSGDFSKDSVAPKKVGTSQLFRSHPTGYIHLEKPPAWIWSTKVALFCGAS